GLRGRIGSRHAGANECKRSRTTQGNSVCSCGRAERDVWLALLAVDVNVTEPLVASDAVSPIPAADSAVLNASIELTLPAPATLLIVRVVAAPVAGVKTKVLPWSEFVPALVRSAAVPATPSGPAPVGAAVVAEAFTEYPVGTCGALLGTDSVA